MLPSSKLLPPRVLERRGQAGEDPLHLRLGLALFGSIALFASVTAAAAALYVFWIVSQDFSA